MRIRGETIKFSTALKRKQTRDIENLENLANLNSHFDLLEDKKLNLSKLENQNFKGKL